jgi:hypothetical protein
MSIETVAAELQTLRGRLDAQRANTHTWPTKEEEYAADLDRYDRRLLKAAAMLGVETGWGRPRGSYLVSDDDRGVLEQRLAAAGLHVRAPADTGRQT